MSIQLTDKLTARTNIKDVCVQVDLQNPLNSKASIESIGALFRRIILIGFRNLTGSSYERPLLYFTFKPATEIERDVNNRIHEYNHMGGYFLYIIDLQKYRDELVTIRTALSTQMSREPNQEIATSVDQITNFIDTKINTTLNQWALKIATQGVPFELKTL